MRPLLSICSFIALTFMLASCEDPIEVPSQFEAPQLVIDAWLTTQPQPQSIILTQSVDYFQGGRPDSVANATVVVCRERDAVCFDFIHQSGGTYVWPADNGRSLGQQDDIFTLRIELDGQIYVQNNEVKANRTAIIDSIRVFFEEESLITEEGFYSELFARDWPGQGDTYLIRAYKNDTLLNRPSEIGLAFDATFDAGANIDGVYFIAPIRQIINSQDEDGVPIPYESGDRIYVEVHSLHRTAFNFLQIALEQIQNTGLFAVPLANAPGNIINAATGAPALGVFNVAEVSSLERVVD